MTLQGAAETDTYETEDEMQDPISSDVHAQPGQVKTPMVPASHSATPINSASKGKATPKASSPQHPALLTLRPLFGARLLADEYEAFELMTSNLVRRGPREPKIRERFRPALRTFLDEHRQVVRSYSKYARSYNKSFEGKHERFHLPVFEDLETKKETKSETGDDELEMKTHSQEHEMEDVTDDTRGGDELEMKTHSQEHELEDVTDDTRGGDERTLGLQLDGAVDFESSSCDGPCRLRNGSPSTTMHPLQSATAGNHCQKAAPEMLDTEDVKMADVNEEPVDQTEADPSGPTKKDFHRIEAEDEATNVDDTEIVAREAPVEEEEDVVVYAREMQLQEHLTAGDGPASSAGTDPGPSSQENPNSAEEENLTESLVALQAEANAIFYELLERAMVCSEPNQSRIENKSMMANVDMTGTEAPPSSGNHITTGLRQPQHSSGVLAGMGAGVQSLGPRRPQSVRPAQSAQSYLAWLRRRRVRFPSVPPNASECALIAKELGRHRSELYDEVLWHWGLETDSKWGDWHKQNRLKVLGEDPRFDDEKMGRWQSWLKEGRDAMEMKGVR
tara:strand:+ start:4694 stop:6379 length:1686 start_codon:yes stop_codon:yes gene_type:complete